MIEVKGLVKTYGPKRAVDGVSFTVRRGDILGFLGPNGGTALVDGHEAALTRFRPARFPANAVLVYFENPLGGRQSFPTPSSLSFPALQHIIKYSYVDMK